MNKKILLYFLLFLFSCQPNKQKSNSNTENSLPGVNRDSSSLLQPNLSLGDLALASLDSSTHASLKNDWKEMALHGRVKLITEDLCSLSKGSSVPGKPCKDHFVYKFNEFGFLVSKLTSTFGSSGLTTKYIYDTTGHQAIQIDIIYREDQVYSSTLFKYDDRGNKVEELEKRNGKDHGKYIYQFDKNNRMVGFEWFALHDGGRRLMTMTQIYDDHDNAVKEILIHKKDTMITTHRYKYDKSNRIVEKVMNYHSKDLKYNKTTTYKYNSNGELVEEIEKERPTLKVTITYDHHGNWVKKLRKYQNNPLPYVHERIIEYY